MSRTYVISGSASGIGRAASEIAKERGHRVVGIDLHEADVVADLSKSEGRDEAARQVLDLTDGSVDAVLGCAGVSTPTALAVQVNFFGVVELLEALQPALASSSAPRAAVVSSMASLQGVDHDLVAAMLAGDEGEAVRIGTALAEQGPGPGYLNYPSSKRALSRWVRRESITSRWAGAHIPLNAVAPGTVITPMTEGLLSTEEGRQLVDGAVPMPLNYHQGPESIALLLMWLTSEENTHCAGQTIYCDGGADASLRGDDVWS